MSVNDDNVRMPDGPIAWVVTGHEMKEHEVPVVCQTWTDVVMYLMRNDMDVHAMTHDGVDVRPCILRDWHGNEMGIAEPEVDA